MTPPERLRQPALRPPPPPPTVTHKVQMIHKLFQLESARKKLEQQLDNFANKAYDEVQGFLNSPLPACASEDLAEALDRKCQAIDKVSSLLNDLVVEPHVCVQPAVVGMGVRTNALQPLGDGGILVTDVLRFGPTLHNVLMASSIAKAVQVFGGTLSLQHLNPCLLPRAAADQQDAAVHGISPSARTTGSSCRSPAEEKEQGVILEEKIQCYDVSVPPAIILSSELNTETPPPLLLPPIQNLLPEIRNPKPVKVKPQMSWGREDDVQVQHQKQTSSQLLHFLQTKAKKTGALEVTAVEWNGRAHAPGSPSQSATVEAQSYRLGNVVTDDLVESPVPITPPADTAGRAPVFRVKRVESSGSLAYTFVIATKTELWDIGDIFTEAQHTHGDGSPAERGGCQHSTAEVEKSSVNTEWKKTQTSTSAPPEPKRVESGATIPRFQVPKFEETEVVVSHIVGPGDFYIRHAACRSELRALVTDSWKASSSYAEQHCIPDIGTQVMGWFPEHEQWCRAQVTKICGVSGDNRSADGAESDTRIEVEVKRLDHGDAACLSLVNIKELTPDMAALPLQAAQVSLANVTPVNGRDWSEEAVGWFKATVHNRTLYARLYPRGPNISVELFLEKGKLGAMRRGASLSLRLAQNGHAQHSKLKNVSRMKKSTAQLKMRKENSDWEKYLVSCYTQSKREH